MDDNIFDDVFRTIVYKLPYLVVPLINEAFGTSYPDDVKIERLQNESFDSDAENERITDTYLKIEGHLYHVECQSYEDRTMVLRMIEYDFRVALDTAIEGDKLVTLRFPQSFVLYLRRGANSKQKDLQAKVIFPNNESLTYTVPCINVGKYGIDEIFEKNLLSLLPFYILRYEKQFDNIEKDDKELSAFLEEFRKIAAKLYTALEGMDRINAYSDLVTYINKISDHLLEKHKKTGTEVKKVMGGHILELESERLKRIGREEGREEQRQEDEKIIAEKDANIAEKDANIAEMSAMLKELKSRLAVYEKV